MLFQIVKRCITLAGAPTLVVVGCDSATLNESFIEYPKVFQSCMSRISLNLSLKPSDLTCWIMKSNASSAPLSDVWILIDL